MLRTVLLGTILKSYTQTICYICMCVYTHSMHIYITHVYTDMYDTLCMYVQTYVCRLIHTYLHIKGMRMEFCFFFLEEKFCFKSHKQISLLW